MDYQQVVSAFGILGKFVSATPFGSGHINDTLKVVIDTEDGEEDYILQKLNTNVFPDPDILSENAFKVVEYLKGIIEARSGDVTRETLHFYPTKEGKLYYLDEDGSCWRLEDIIKNTRSYDLCTSEKQFESTGFALGSFMADLANFSADELGEVIKNFHNTHVRFETFTKEVEKNLSGRADTCQEEIAFALARKEMAESLVKQLELGDLPLRVTHNDTKINNILMDEETDQPVCIIDLDTVMPGACAYDFGVSLDHVSFGIYLIHMIGIKLFITYVRWNPYSLGMITGCLAILAISVGIYLFSALLVFIGKKFVRIIFRIFNVGFR